MSDWGRIHRDLPNHPKFQKASLAAIGLWTLGNAWTRKHRSSGAIPHEEALRLARGDEELIRELVTVELWDEEGERFTYHDYLEHNADEKPKTIAAGLVCSTIDPQHPSVVRQQLIAKTAELIEDGQETRVLKIALQRWNDRANAGPALLPHFVSDVIREANDGLLGVLRECWKSLDVSPLKKFGLIFAEPDIPKDIKTVEQIRAYMKKAKRDWLRQLQEETK